MHENYFGLHKTTLIDYPGEVAATLFIPGCNLRCPYCHNPDMVLSGGDKAVLNGWEQIQAFILSRKRVLGGICLTGGEPLLYPDLERIIDFIHAQGLKVKIDTNGTLPEKLKSLQIEYIAMDIKTSPVKYKLLGGAAVKPEWIIESINWILSSNIESEFRTTVVPGIVDRQDIEEITRLIAGARRYILSQFRPGTTLDPAFAERNPYPQSELEAMLTIINRAGIKGHIRRGAGYNQQ